MSWAGLLAAEHWVRRTGVSHPDIDALIDHAWRWSTIGRSESFIDWYAALPRLQGLLTLPADVTAEAIRADVPAEDVATLVRSLDQLVYGNLFGALQFAWVEQDLDGIADIVERYELGLPSPDRLPASSRGDDGGWGYSVDASTVSMIRALDWTAPT